MKKDAQTEKKDTNDTKTNNKEKKCAKKRIQLKKNQLIVIISGIILVATLVIALFWGGDHTHQIDTTATLKKIIKTENLNTVKYTYNAVATKKDGKTIKYYVAYEGVVKAGVEFDDIKIEKDTKTKTYTITIPEVKITETKVDEKSLDFIFTKSKYDTKESLEEAKELCEKDLIERTKKEELLIVAAQENSMSSIQAFFQPWIETLDKEYKVVFVQEVSENEK